LGKSKQQPNTSSDSDLANIVGGDVITSSSPDEFTKSETDDLDRVGRLALIEAQRIKNRGDAADIAARNKYAKLIFGLTVGWLSAVMLVTVLCGLKWLTLDTSVLLALVGSVSVNVLGFFGGVIGYLFPKRK
jgi:hypothetical protein